MKILLVTVTKDTINFIQLYKKFKPKDMELLGVLDVSLKYRKNIKEKVKRLEVPIFESFQDIPSEIDLIVKCDHGVSDFRLNELVVDFDETLLDLQELESKIKRDYDNYIQNLKGTEYTFVLKPKFQSIINSYFFEKYKNSKILSIYEYPLLISSQDSENVETFLQRKYFYDMTPLGKYIDDDTTVNNWVQKQETKKFKPIFVLGSDYGSGKFSYIMQHDHFMSPDPFMNFFNRTFYYGDFGSVNENFVAHMFETIQYLYYKGVETSYIKIEGKLEPWICSMVGFQGSLQSSWGNFHLWFEDYEFHIVFKDGEDLTRLKKQVDIFKKMYFVEDDKIKFIKSVGYASKFEEVNL